MGEKRGGKRKVEDEDEYRGREEASVWVDLDMKGQELSRTVRDRGFLRATWKSEKDIWKVMSLKCGVL